MIELGTGGTILLWMAIGFALGLLLRKLKR